MELDLRLVQSQLAPNGPAAAESVGKQAIEGWIANNLQQRCCQRNFGGIEQFSERLVSQDHLAIGIDYQQSILHCRKNGLHPGFALCDLLLELLQITNDLFK